MSTVNGNCVHDPTYAPRPGTLLGPYEIAAPLGAGGMGKVYRATSPRLGRSVILRVLTGDLARAPERKLRFEQEARTVAAQVAAALDRAHRHGGDAGISNPAM